MRAMIRPEYQPSRALNIALLASGFAVVQGAMLIAQSWLVLHDQVVLVGLFGSLFTFGTLALSIIDWGGVVVLARHELGESDGANENLYWSLSIVRGAVALSFSGIALLSLVNEQTGFAGSYAMAAIPGLLAGSLSMAGLLDGAHRSGLSGISTSLPALVSALVLVCVPGLAPQFQGLLLGLAFSLGTISSLAVQVWLLRRLGRLPAFARPTLGSVVMAGRHGGLVLLTLLPSYASYRIQVAISVWLLGPAGTGLFIYAKQIVNGVQQGIGFIRRAEFPRLVVALRQGPGIGAVLRIQTSGIAVGLAASVLLGVIGLLMNQLPHDQLGSAGGLLAWFAPTVITAAIYGALSQAYMASNRAGTTATVTNLNLLLLIGGTAAAVASTGIVGFAVAETLVNMLGIAVLARLWHGRADGGPS